MLAQGFTRIVRERSPAEFNERPRSAMRSRLREFVSFARGLSEDYTAVINALRYEWSSGQLEGQVDRLKPSGWKHKLSDPPNRLDTNHKPTSAGRDPLYIFATGSDPASLSIPLDTPLINDGGTRGVARRGAPSSELPPREPLAVLPISGIASRQASAADFHPPRLRSISSHASRA